VKDSEYDNNISWAIYGRNVNRHCIVCYLNMANPKNDKYGAIKGDKKED